MTKHQRSALWTLLAAVAIAAPLSAQATQGPRAVDPPTRTPAVQRFLAESSPRFRAFAARHPGAWIAMFDEDSQAPLSIVGSGIPVPRAALAAPARARAAADRLLESEADLWGVPVADLRFLSAMESGPIRAFRWQQMSDGLEVQGGFVEIQLHRAGRAVLLGSSAIEVAPGLRARARLTAEQAQAVVARDKRLLAFDTVETRDLVIFGARKNGSIEARLAFAVEVSQPSQRIAERVLVDAENGAILEVRSHIFDSGVHGQVSSTVQPNLSPLAPTQILPIPGVTVTLAGGGSAVTDSQGNYSIAASGTGPFNVSVALVGPDLNVIDLAGSPATAQGTAAPDGNGGYVASLDPNPAPGETSTAQTTAAYLHWLMRGYVVSKLPGYAPAFPQQPVYVNEAATCNAYFNDADGSLHFYHSGGSCGNTCYSTVLDHEFGHGVDAHFGAIMSASLSEGAADMFAMYHTQQPIVGQDFFGPGSIIRTGENGTTWPASGCGFEPHCVGETYMGFAWQARKALIQSLGGAAGSAVAESVVMGATALNPLSIPLAVQEAFLLDDDDADLSNGTPHFSQLSAAASMKGFTLPVAIGIAIAHAPHLDTWNQTIPYPIVMDLTLQSGVSLGSLAVQYSDDDGATTQSVAASATATPGRYRAEIPPHLGPAVIHYRLVVTNNLGATQTIPPGDDAYRFAVGAKTPLFQESFESGGAGWSHSASAGADDWQIGTSPATEANAYGLDPLAAADGAKWAGTDLGLPGAGGKTGFYEPNYASAFESPSINASGAAHARLRYRRWLSVEGSQYDVARLLVAGAALWTNPTQPEMVDGAWTLQDLPAAAANQQSNVTIRFELSSDGGLQFGGWNVDALELYDLAVIAAGSYQLSSGSPTTPIGTNLVLTSSGDPGAPFAVYLSGSEGPFNVPGFGTVDVGGDALFFYSAALDGAGHHAFTLPIPNIPLLIGLKLHLVGYEIAPGGYPQIGAAIVVTLS
jgi:hypothetical protein